MLAASRPVVTASTGVQHKNLLPVISSTHLLLQGQVATSRC